MTVSYVRVINERKGGTVHTDTILVDKINKSQGNFEGYARRAKQKIYVPQHLPVPTVLLPGNVWTAVSGFVDDTTIKGYVDLVPTDEVLLSLNQGSILGLVAGSFVTTTRVDSSLLRTPTITSASNAAGSTTIGGASAATSTFVSVLPDVTYVTITDLLGVSQVLTAAAIVAAGGSVAQNAIVIPDVAFGLWGPPTTGWTARVQANRKLSNVFTLT
jgi:hypothetical protein